MLAQTIAAITTVGSQVLWVTRDGSPDDGPAEPMGGSLSSADAASDDERDDERDDEAPRTAEDDSFVRDPSPKRHSGLRLLCLHGHGSNNDITALQLQFLRLRDVHGVSCDCLQATSEVPPNSLDFWSFSDGPFWSWFSVWWSGWQARSATLPCLRCLRCFELSAVRVITAGLRAGVSAWAGLVAR